MDAHNNEHPEWSQLYLQTRQCLAQRDFVEFIRCVAPWFIIERVHVAIARHLEAIVDGEIDRLMIHMPPRTGKTTLTSVLFPAFYLGRYPIDQVMSGSHSFLLAKEFGADTRDLISAPSYQSIFPHVRLVKDRAAAGSWKVRDPDGFRNGGYFAAGAEQRIAGRGFNLWIGDDLTSEQEKDSENAMRKRFNWFGGGLYTRQQIDRSAMVLMGTRWRHDDVPGRLVEQSKNRVGADKWVILNIPALLTKGATVLVNRISDSDAQVAKLPKLQHYEEGNEVHGTFSPKRFPLDRLLRFKANIPERDWQAQYMGAPSVEEGAILKKKFWRKWPEGKKLPKSLFTFATVDTAFEAGEVNDYSAVTVWNVFETVDRGRDHREYNHTHVMLAGAWYDKVDAVDLEQEMARISKEFQGTIDLWLVEKRASGIQLIQEMRRRRYNVQGWLPPGPPGAKGKLPRAYASSMVFAQGGVWFIDSPLSREVIELCAMFPYGDNMDIPDTVTMAVMYLRDRFWIALPTDEETEDEEKARIGKELARKPRRMYGQVERDRPGRLYDPDRRKLYG